MRLIGFDIPPRRILAVGILAWAVSVAWAFVLGYREALLKVMGE